MPRAKAQRAEGAENVAISPEGRIAEKPGFFVRAAAAPTKEASRQATSERPMALVGKRVLLNGLVWRPEFNLQVGEALVFDEQCGRYTVCKIAAGVD